jgi:hypothetical protein
MPWQSHSIHIPLDTGTSWTTGAFSAICALASAEMPQDQDFGFQPLLRLEAVAQHAQKQEADCNHLAIMF